MRKDFGSGKKIGGVSAAQLLAQAVSALRANELAEAHRLCTIIVEKDKKNAVALHLLGIAEALRKNGATALYLFDRALKITPRNADIFADKGRVLSEMGRHVEALPCYELAVSLNPMHGIALYNQGCTLLALDCPADALSLFDRLITLAPGHAPAYLGRALALTDLRRFNDAVESAGQALKLNADYAEALQSRGLAHMAMHRHELALVDFKKAALINPDLENLQGNLVLTKMLCCDWDRIAQDQSSLANAVRSGRPVAPFIFCVVSDFPQDQLTCSRSYAARNYSPVVPQLWGGQKYQHERIRVGYVSADFHEHPTAFLMAGLFEEHDRSRFEITAISLGRDDGSAIRNRIQSSVEKFIDAKAMNEADVADLIRQHEIDILLDLKGFTEDSRFGIFPYRAAPIQVSYLGFPGTTGAECIDYVIADRIIIPADQYAFYSEKTVVLPHSYQINDDKRPIADMAGIRAELGLPPSGFVFCCFSGNYKITPEVFDVWMSILKHVEGSVLWLFESNATAASNLRKEAVARGVEPKRLVFAMRLPLAEHLARHRFADLFLDTLPCNAHTTASDALWAGVPVLTCLGTTLAGRVAGSLVNAIGLPELATPTLKAYQALAINLATKPEKLAHIKQILVANRLTTPLFDTKLCTRHLEAAFTAMYERHQAGLVPDHIVVPG